MTDSELLDVIANLRIQLSANMEEIDVEDTAAIMMQATIFIAGVDATLQLRQGRD